MDAQTLVGGAGVAILAVLLAAAIVSICVMDRRRKAAWRADLERRERERGRSCVAAEKGDG